ncbi:uncharacterized protein F5891DRAFT_1193438 [Suillus fuscotomentosus]|uniref:PCI domain-containing protein n=1 Tax=Suillus fuscotomentosus TaxID=1912939 RepID=A0AAD4HFZ3_9AGAM|nr:uncharacterized protein F5891DRAFT_1193438 [Suillus fuscotomentosus]KAG1896205.1 hypothetical protein F5891DRAFT_1193438 [Suillus fuscotomentosus]
MLDRLFEPYITSILHILLTQIRYTKRLVASWIFDRDGIENTRNPFAFLAHYTTAYPYFYENFENMSSQDDPAALNALKYMLLCKAMLNMPEDLTSLLSIKLAVKYAQLHEIESKALRDYKRELSSDPTIGLHLAALYNALLQLLRIIEPHSMVEIDYIAKQVGQGRQDAEAKLSQMILDKAFHGVLDQGQGCLINTYGAAFGTLEQVSKHIGVVNI